MAEKKCRVTWSIWTHICYSLKWNHRKWENGIAITFKWWMKAKTTRRMHECENIMKNMNRRRKKTTKHAPRKLFSSKNLWENPWVLPFSLSPFSHSPKNIIFLQYLWKRQPKVALPLRKIALKKKLPPLKRYPLPLKIYSPRKSRTCHAVPPLSKSPSQPPS